MDGKKLATLLFPEETLTPEEILTMHPRRNLPEGTFVTRFAPSPTGMLHLGGLYAALFAERLAHQSGGIFYLRIEDTDKKREIKESIPGIIDSLAYFGIRYDEGVTGPETEKGNYGPYKQSLRKHIYKAWVKELIQKGYAYPCFCTEEKLEEIRVAQKAAGVPTGYYGSWAMHRNMGMTEVRAELERGTSFVIRLKAPAKITRIVFRDVIKGRVEMEDNYQDIVLMKTDGLPTYHLAHVIDDHLMGTTHCIRGDEWLPSTPLHLQLFAYLGWMPPSYGHLAPLLKLDGNSKRKFSKRKDMDAIVDYYIKSGYPGEAVIEYCLNLINSNYEEWRRLNPEKTSNMFTVQLCKAAVGGALFDSRKLNDVSRTLVATYPEEKIFQAMRDWAGKYDHEMNELMQKYPDYTIKILNIERTPKKPKKDLAKWSDFKSDYGYFYDELFNRMQSCPFPDKLSPELIRNILDLYPGIYRAAQTKTNWFLEIRKLAESLGLAGDMKAYRENPGAYPGHIGDVAMVLRIALTKRTTTPELYEVMRVQGEERVRERLAIAERDYETEKVFRSQEADS